MSNLQERDILLESWFSISINGEKFGENFLRYVQQVQIEEEEDKLPLASIVVIDPKKVWLNTKSIVKGSSIAVAMGHRKNNRNMFNGQITHIDANYPDTGDPTLIIVAMDKAVKLMESREARSFKNAKVSDVVKIMLGECGLIGEVQDTGAVIDFIPQESETNLEFITRWRKKFQWRFDKIGDSSYYFGADRANYGKLKTLGYKTGGMEIMNFAPSYQDYETSEDETISDTDNNGNVAEYTVRDTKQAIVYPGINDTSSPIGRA